MKTPKMDFLGIKKKYPKSYHVLCHTSGAKTSSWGQALNPFDWNKDNVKDREHNDNRTLYDFFNSQNIHIEIRPELYTSGVNWNWQVFWYELPHQKYKKEIEDKFYNGTTLYGDNNEYPSQAHAEIAAWDMAFRALEAKLNNEKSSNRGVYDSMNTGKPLVFK